MGYRIYGTFQKEKCQQVLESDGLAEEGGKANEICEGDTAVSVEVESGIGSAEGPSEEDAEQCGNGVVGSQDDCKRDCDLRGVLQSATTDIPSLHVLRFFGLYHYDRRHDICLPHT